jgi:hypothetical protein
MLVRHNFPVFAPWRPRAQNSLEGKGIGSGGGQEDRVRDRDREMQALTNREPLEEGMKKFLRFIQPNDVLTLLKTTTGGLITTSNVEGTKLQALDYWLWLMLTMAYL